MQAALRAAAEKWVQNGGKLSYGLTPAPSERTLDESETILPCHKLLVKGYRLETHASMFTYNSDSFTQGTWPSFHAWSRELAKRLGARAWAACLERSLHASIATPKFHLHLYLYWKGGDGLIRSNTNDLTFDSVAPRVDVCTRTNPLRLRNAAMQGLYYVQIMKLGTVAAATNYHPWRDYTPKPEWLEGWWLGQKLSHAQFNEYSMHFRCGHAKRKRDLEEVLRSEREKAIDKHLKQERESLCNVDPDKPMREFPELTTFVTSFTRSLRRRPIVLIVGGTNLGKSMLAASVLQRVGKVLDVPDYLEVTVEDDTNLDLSEFDLAQHAGVLLDGVSDVLMLKRHREALQGRMKKARGGKSSTMIYSYQFTLCRRAVLVTMDLSAKNLHMLLTDHWLSNRKNVLVLRLDAPAWVTADVDVTAPRRAMTSWTVEEVATWMESQDMAGPASFFRTQGVNGEDLLSFETAQQLSRDLGTTTFLARKVLLMRDGHLGSQW